MPDNKTQDQNAKEVKSDKKPGAVKNPDVRGGCPDGQTFNRSTGRCEDAKTVK